MEKLVLTRHAAVARLPRMVDDSPSFTSAPFAGGLEPFTFQRGPAQEEALARLEWLVENAQRCGLVLGDDGLGKSHLLAAAGRRLAGLGAEVALLSLAGLPEGEWLELLLSRLPLHHLSRAEDTTPWQKLEDRLRENTLMERPTALLFDDLDQAPADARLGIARLVAAVEPRFARTLVVATANPAGSGQIPEAIRQRAAVRIELAAWSVKETASFLAAELGRVGGDPGWFSPEAAATLARFAGGVPRTVIQLARLAVAAAVADSAERIDAALVERVWRELAPDGSVMLAARPLDDDYADADHSAEPSATEPPPRVRVVRRLFG
jgi:general secretion pathway protein A